MQDVKKANGHCEEREQQQARYQTYNRQVHFAALAENPRSLVPTSIRRSVCPLKHWISVPQFTGKKPISAIRDDRVCGGTGFARVSIES